MKIAICLSGHLRTYERTYQSVYDQLLNKYDCDVFISTWTNLGESFCYGPHYTEGKDKGDPTVEVGKIKNIYKPISIHMDDANIEPTSNELKKLYNGIRTQNGAQVAQTMVMLYKIWDCNQLKKEHEEKNDFKYDIVIRFRFDIFLKHINIEKALKNVQFVSGHMGLNDIVFMGPSEEMNNVCDIYTVMTPGIPFNSFVNIEQILHMHVINNNIPYNISPGDSASAFEYERYVAGSIYDLRGKKLRDY